MPAGLRYGVEVRAAGPADAAEVARLLAEARFPCSPGEVAVRLDAIRVHPAAVTLVATGYGGLSGVVALGWAPALQEPRLVAHISLLIVDPAERRRGIGRTLLKAASQAARTAGCDRLLLTLVAAAPDTEAFCLGTGFVPLGPSFERPLRRRG